MSPQSTFDYESMVHRVVTQSDLAVLGSRHLCRQMVLPSEKVRTACNDGSREAAPGRRCRTPAVVVKLTITSVEASLRGKAIWKMISKVLFRWSCSLMRPRHPTTSDLSFAISTDELNLTLSLRGAKYDDFDLVLCTL